MQNDYTAHVNRALDPLPPEALRRMMITTARSEHSKPARPFNLTDACAQCRENKTVCVPFCGPLNSVSNELGRSSAELASRRLHSHCGITFAAN
jgi:hypothetical protein